MATSILIVEDEAVVALDLRGELEAFGYHVVGIAATVQQAFELASRHRPHLALMDIMLRGEDDGIAAAGRLRRDYGTPVIFLTSFSDSETVSRAARQGAYGYLTKPFQTRELRAGIEVALWKSQMERQLRESDRWFAQTLRCVQDGIIAVDPRGTVKFMNPVAERLTGLRAEEAAGRHLGEVVRFIGEAPGEVVQVTGDALRSGRVEGTRYARILENRTGVIAVDQSAGPIRDENGQLIGSVLVLRDASERLRQKALLRASEERFRNAFEHAPVGMAMVALDGKFLQVNDALCRLLGRTQEQVGAQTQASVTHADDVAREADRLSDLLQSNEPLAQFEKRYLCGPVPEPVSVLVNVSVLRSDAQPACFLYQVHDLTAQRTAATQLAQLAEERLKREAGEAAEQARSELLSRVSHEMRTPLNAVLGFSQLLQIQHASGPSASRRYADHILNAGQHLLALVDDVLALQRAGDGTLNLQLTRVDLDAFLSATIGLLEPSANERAIRLLPAAPSGLSVRADPTRLRQILLNVGSNAVKYNVHGGSVRFEIRPGAAGRVEIDVQDGGIGMNADQLEHLYEPFNRLGREALTVPGVGLGMVITRKLVERMEGTMAVRSEADVGTCVTIGLPRAD